MSYHTLIIDPLREMMSKAFDFVPTLLVTLGILLVGWLMAKVISEMLLRLFKAIHVDKITEQLGVTNVLKKGGVDHKPSELLSRLVYWVIMVIFLIIAVNAFGLTMASILLEKILAYIPSVISGVVVLILGLLLANIVSNVIYLIVSNTNMPNPDVVSRLSKWAIVVFVTVAFLKEIGFEFLFTGANLTIVLAGFIFALALAFGLAGKDIAARYLEVLKPKK